MPGALPDPSTGEFVVHGELVRPCAPIPPTCDPDAGALTRGEVPIDVPANDEMRSFSGRILARNGIAVGMIQVP